MARCRVCQKESPLISHYPGVCLDFIRNDFWKSVADWVWAGGRGAGFPEFSSCNGPEYGYRNLAVFFYGCSFNCLFCQK